MILMKRRWLKIPEVAWLGIAIGVALRLIFLILFDNLYSHEAEAYSKIHLAQVWAYQGFGYPDLNFGPLHTALIYAVTAPFKNPVLPARLLSWICGCLTLPIFFLMVREAFSDEKIAIWSVWLLSLMPVHVRTSAVSLAEAPYGLAVAAGLWFVFRLLRQKEAGTGSLFGAAIGLAAAGMIRFEAWLIYPVACLILLRKRPWMAVFLGGMLAAFPMMHMTISKLATGDFFSFAKVSSLNFRMYMTDMPLILRAFAWLDALRIGMSVAPSIFACVGLALCVIWKRYLAFAAIPLFILAVLHYKTLTATLDPSLTRYSLMPAMLLTPFAVLGFIAALSAAKAQRTYVIATISILIGLSMVIDAVIQQRREQAPDAVKAVAAYLRDRCTDADRIVLDAFFHPYLAVESRKSPSSLRLPKKLSDLKTQDYSDVREILAIWKPTVVEVDDVSGRNRLIFAIPPGSHEFFFGGYTFSLAIDSPPFFVYRLQPVYKTEENTQ